MHKIIKVFALFCAISLLASLMACNVGLKRKDKLITDENKFTFNILSDDTYEVMAKSGETFSGTIILPAKYNGKAVTKISNHAFRETDITKIATSDCTVIGNYAFYECRKLESIEWADNVTVIGESAFKYCVNLINIDLPAYLKRIESNCFANCVELRNVEIPASVEYIAEDAFLNCEKATFMVSADNLYYKVENNKIVKK